MSFNNDLPYRPGQSQNMEPLHTSEPSDFDRILAEIKSDLHRATQKQQEFKRRVEGEETVASSDVLGSVEEQRNRREQENMGHLSRQLQQQFEDMQAVPSRDGKDELYSMMTGRQQDDSQPAGNAQTAMSRQQQAEEMLRAAFDAQRPNQAGRTGIQDLEG